MVLDGTNGDCVNTQCVDSVFGVGTGYNSFTLDAVTGYTYYFVIDGYNGAEGPFQAELDCSP